MRKSISVIPVRPRFETPKILFDQYLKCGTAIDRLLGFQTDLIGRRPDPGRTLRNDNSYPIGINACVNSRSSRRGFEGVSYGLPWQGTENDGLLDCSVLCDALDFGLRKS